MSLPTRLDPDGYKSRLEARCESKFLAQAARAIVTKKLPADRVVELVNSGAFTLHEAWLAVDAMQDQEQAK
jgi:hypothetical protein